LETATAPQRKVRVAVNGYGVIGKQVPEAIALQGVALVGVADVATDWRMRVEEGEEHAVAGRSFVADAN
jgi:glyceraldehyde-3-phosphate dehydrogenase (NAD(P))